MCECHRFNSKIYGNMCRYVIQEWWWWLFIAINSICFIVISFAEQEQEVKSLRLQLAAVKTAHQDLISKVFGLKEKHRKLTAELEQAKEKKDLLVIDLLSLCTVPSLFEVSWRENASDWNVIFFVSTLGNSNITDF